MTLRAEQFTEPVAFPGEGPLWLRELHITTSAPPLDTAAEPLAGSLFEFSSGMRPPDQRLCRVDQQ